MVGRVPVAASRFGLRLMRLGCWRGCLCFELCVNVSVTRRPKDTGGATKTSAEYHLPDYTEPEPSTARAPEEEGEAT